jgi:polysaccharide pyruvyl transferase WcaK-like protein
MKKKVLHVASISGVNIGDILIAQCVSRLISGIEESRDLKGEKYLHKTGKKSNWFILKVKKINFLRKLYNNLKLYIITKKMIKNYAVEYDELVIGGGNLIYNKSNCDHLDLCYVYVKEFSKKRKKIKLLSVGVGPFEKGFKRKVREIINNSDYISVRDKYSLEVLNEIDAKSNKVIFDLVIDPVWFISDFVEILKKDNGYFFGVNVMDFSKTKQENTDNFCKYELIENIISISKNVNLKPIFIVSAFNNDLDFTNLIVKYLNQEYDIASKIMFLPTLESSNDDWQTFGNFDFILSHRMHVSIVALSLGIPTVVFSWQRKVESVISTIYPKENIITNSANFEDDEILKKIEFQKKNRSFFTKKLIAAKAQFRSKYDHF